MQNSPYLDLDRDLEVLEEIVACREAERREKPEPPQVLLEEDIWKPVYPAPVESKR